MLIQELMSKTNDLSTIKSWFPILETYLSKLEQCDYDYLCDEIYETIYGEVLSVDKAKSLVKEMKPYGEHWNIDRVKEVLHTNCKDSSNYYVMNMMYNDYYEMFKDDTNKYIEMARLWLNDEDNSDGDIKTYRYATRV